MMKFLKKLDFPKIAVYLAPVVIFGATVWGVVSCTKEKRDVEKNVELVVQVKQDFVLPAVPASLTDPTARAEYLASHYWDNFNFADTTLCLKPKVTEQAFVDYVDVLIVVQPTVAYYSTQSLLKSTKQDPTGRMFRYFLELSEKYLYEPNSPMRNEELYLPVVEYMLSDSSLNETEKIRPAYVKGMILKNRMGTKGADFSYKLASGKTGRLYDLKTDYTLVFFNNPDCHACGEIKDAIIASSVFSESLQTGKLTILAFYPDEDLSLWRKHLSEIPPTWINGYDNTGKFKNKAVYDLRAIPSLYLLDKDKTVILKDADFIQVEKRLTETI